MQLRDLFDEHPINHSEVMPLALQCLLKENIDVCKDWERAENLLLAARKAMPEQIELTVALYKVYAYSCRFDESLGLINEVLYKSSEKGGFIANWQTLNYSHICKKTDQTQ